MEEQMNQQTFSEEDPDIEQDEEQNQELEENGQLNDFWGSDISSKLKQNQRRLELLLKQLEESRGLREIQDEKQQIENKIQSEKERKRIVLQERILDQKEENKLSQLRSFQEKLKGSDEPHLNEIQEQQLRQKQPKKYIPIENKPKEDFFSRVRKLFWNSSKTHKSTSDLNDPLMDTYADEKEEQKQGKLSSFPKQKEL